MPDAISKGIVVRVIIFKKTSLKKQKRVSACYGANPLYTGADETNRTSDLLITNQLLYRLSYISQDRYSNKKYSRSARCAFVIVILCLFYIDLRLFTLHHSISSTEIKPIAINMISKAIL
jgi:hypothetical protein